VFKKAVLAFLLLPGVVAFLAPAGWVVARGLEVRWPVGFLLVAQGVCGLLWCVQDFYVAGKGTLAPWAPPRRLVTIGLYRMSRNPMYVTVTLILLGWAIVFGSPELLVYALVVLAAFHLRIVFGEEPWLAKTHGDAWARYALRVRRWL